ncbi:methyltransferase protein 17 [Tropilaelaps mercedesae]|uniref:Methyltransferase protein 17 n=1 Tax=Tropilaelaps mercedesae TaxID=418985 RepID=A0A1V9XF33_9ACAR|nr:methyltransferase protein 17 [Tropilaelaps mercedesae]
MEYTKICSTSILEDLLLSDRFNFTQLTQGAEILNNQLWSRLIPVENKEINEKAHRLQKDMFGDQLNKLSREELKSVMPQVKEVIVDKVRSHTYRWRPMEYDEFGSFCYLVGRAPLEYAALRQVLKEIRILDPLLQPQSCLDFGSGIGTVWWALKEQFPASFKEYFSIDSSKYMRDLARFLVQGGQSNQELSTADYSQRSKLPESCKITYDLVVSAYSLMELHSKRERQEVIKNLWAKTKRHLILIENGTRAGFQLVQEARSTILDMSNIYNGDDSRAAFYKGYVLAPCTHELPCQRFSDASVNYPCSFQARYMNILKPDEKAYRTLYSYVVLSRSQPEALFEGPPCARLIQKVLLRRKHVICRMCTSNGDIKEKVFTKGKHNKEVYHAARSAKWGDLFIFENVLCARKIKSNYNIELEKPTDKCSKHR